MTPLPQRSMEHTSDRGRADLISKDDMLVRAAQPEDDAGAADAKADLGSEQPKIKEQPRNPELPNSGDDVLGERS